MIIGAEAIEMLLDDIVLSGSLVDEIPLSAIVVSYPAVGKSEIVKQYRNCEGVRLTTSTTFFSLMQMHHVEIAQHKVHHMIMPDMAPLVNITPPSAAMAALAQFGALAEEGVSNWHSGRGNFAIGNEPIHCGLIFCITQKSYTEKLAFLGDEGFLGRFIVISYDISDKLKEHIHSRIEDGSAAPTINDRQLEQFSERQLVKLGRAEAEWLTTSGAFSTTSPLRDSSDTKGFRTHRKLRTLFKANALRHGRREVNGQDIEDFKAMRPFMGSRMQLIGMPGEQLKHEETAVLRIKIKE